MKREAQVIEPIQVSDLLVRMSERKEVGDRMVAISCAAVGGEYEITYSFEDADHRFVHYRITVPPGASIPSVSPVYWGAFVFENEIHDLYGIDVKGINVDYNGHFFVTKVPRPYAISPPPETPPAGKQGGED